MPKRVRALLVVAFVLADVALGAAAWRHVHREPKASDVDVAQLTAAPDPSGGAPTAQAFDLAPEELVMVDANAAGIVITARRGACSGEAAMVRVSSDGGKTLNAVSPNITEVLGVTVGDGDDAAFTVIGADADCAIVATRSTDGGRTWEQASAAAEDGWYPAVGTLTGLVTPAGPSRPGCKMASLSAIDATFARVACTDGRLRGTGDAGKTWITLGKLTNLRAASFDDYTNGVALARHEGCADYTFATSDGGRTWRPRGCVGGDAAQALAGEGARLVAVVDGQIAVSTDAGKTWAIRQQPEVTSSPSPTTASPTPSPTASPTR